MYAVQKLLSLPDALRLAQTGVKLPTLHAYVYSLDTPDDPATSALIRSFDAGDFPDEKLRLGCCPAPDVADIWSVMPWALQIGQEKCILQLQGRNLFGFYAAQYYHYPKMRSRAGGSGREPVAAAGSLLLYCLQQGLLTAEEINQKAQSLNA